MKYPKITRREFVRTVTRTGLVATTGIGLSACDDDDTTETKTHVSFSHGIASGDPLSDRVILWTRISPSEDGSYTVQWEVAEDRNFTTTVTRGESETNLTRDYTVKVDASGLLPNTHYFYRFSSEGATSEVGSTKTLPVGNTDQVKLAVFSCANYPAGYFHIYGNAAKHDDIDAVLHLGDYLYEYGVDGYASEDAGALDRVSDPATEIVSLDDYRARYAQYRSDTDLQTIHAKLPFICIWDDHEFCNDAWQGGAENHQPDTEGDYFERQASALKAWYEWLPVREQDSTQPLKIYRSFDFGDLFSLHMLDTRVIGRDQQIDYANYIDTATGAFDAPRWQADLTASDRQLLGAEQTDWLQTQMALSTATWQVLGQQVLMGRMSIPAPVALQQISLGNYAALLQQAAVTPETLTETEQAILAQPYIPYNLDAWDGYFMNRETILGTSLQLDKNLVVLSGDTHNAWANDLQDLQGNQVGVEFAASSVSSPGLEEYLAGENPDAVASGLEQLIPTLRYANTQHRGYLVLDITQEKATAEWLFVDTVKAIDYEVLSERTRELQVLPGSDNRMITEVS